MMPPNALPRSVEDIEGKWIAQDFDSGLVERCRRYWSVSVDELPNEALAIFLRQRIGMALVVPEAKRRIEAGFDDDSEMYEGEMLEALRYVGEA